MNLNDKVVVVTGAGRGLGREMAGMIAAKGGQLALAGKSQEGLKETVRLCSITGRKARYYLTDVSDESAVEKLFQDVVRDFGRVDAVINNAGITRDSLLVKAKDGKVTGKLALDPRPKNQKPLVHKGWAVFFWR